MTKLELNKWQVAFGVADCVSRRDYRKGRNRAYKAQDALRDYFEVMEAARESVEPSWKIVGDVLEIVASSQDDGRFILALSNY